MVSNFAPHSYSCGELELAGPASFGGPLVVHAKDASSFSSVFTSDAFFED
jgi:hypothetical protein